jgi:hypothetical protein
LCIERVIVERPTQSALKGRDADEAEQEIGEPLEVTEVTRAFGTPQRHWAA